MNTFASAVINQESRTANGMKALASTSNSVVDLFYNIGASRGKDILPAFTAAYVENKELALRIALWARDARGGAGERELFRSILKHLEVHDSDSAKLLLAKVPELGRWDDIFVFKTSDMKALAYTMLGDALRAGNGLAAKWTPRKGPIAAEIRTFFGMTPKQYRTSLVRLTKVVETQMCANDWDNINFSHVPSIASARYKKAFNRHTTKFTEYVESLVNKDPSVKVNAGAIFPHDVLKGVTSTMNDYTETEVNHIIAQWESLPNYVGNASILPMVDVSGSMDCPAGGKASKSTTTCLDISLSLGLYLSDKNKGAFKDLFLTFSSKSELKLLKGNVIQKLEQLTKSDWGMTTNLHAAFDNVLTVAMNKGVPQSEMPSMILILSDMQFDRCVSRDDTAMTMLESKYRAAGYEMPSVVFWNLNSSSNVPVKADKSGAALVSGFSPAILTALLAADMSSFTPTGIMLSAIMNDRYTI